VSLAHEAELVERARLGDRAAAGLLVRRHEGVAYAVALARLRDPEAARDVAQDALLRALTTLPKLRDADRFGAWVARIAVRLAADFKRRRRERPGAAESPDPGPGPLEALARRERGRRVLEELGRLPERLRQVFLLRHLEGASYARIGELLDLPEGTIGWMLHRARASLRGSLRDLVEDEQ